MTDPTAEALRADPGAFWKMPQAAVIEIIERGKQQPVGMGLIVPNEVRINGVPLLASADHPVIVHEMSTSADQVVSVTLTLLARRVFIGHETDL